ncbi:YdbH domain-containing protein [Marinobacter confluentis]|nr:YdbH domain-containing protein [Marinobacter confluentis]
MFKRILVLLVILALSGALYARHEWQQWRAANHIQDLEWQGMGVSWNGVSFDSLSVTQLRDGQPWHARGDLKVSGLLTPGEREFTTGSMTVTAPLPNRALAGWQPREGQVNLVIAGTASEQSATLTLMAGSRLELAELTAPEGAASFDRLTLDLAGLEVNGEYTLAPISLESLVFSGPIVAAAQAIHQPQLLPQPWRLKGHLNGNLESVALDGRLSSDAGADTDISLQLPFNGVPELDVELVSTGALGGRALAATFTAWPEALEITEGTAKAVLGVKLLPEGTSLNGDFEFETVSGLFDRTAWTGLNGSVALNISGEQLDVSTSDLSLDTVNPGIALSNIRFTGRYGSALEKPLEGELSVNRASAGLLGGLVQVEPGQWQLSDLSSRRPLRVPVDLSGIKLSELMQVYPAEGLAGSGVIHGRIPVLVGPDGVTVEAGRVAAMAPGGTLKLPADRLRGLAQGNEAMALVVQAMENFNYDVLSSTIDYDQDGRLMLGLRLEGNSPEVRDGHPIVLNINLEEDIPALLTSLQLSGRVNEAVTEKVRDLIQKRNAKPQSDGSGK